MAKARDILQTALDGDLLVKSGDFAVGFSDEAHVYDIIVTERGDWKNDLNVGLGVQRYSESSGQENVIAQNIKIMLQADGYTVKKPIVSYDLQTGELDINPNCERL